jgi:hypothetical protein
MSRCGPDTDDAMDVIEYLRGRRVAVVALRPEDRRRALEQSVGRAYDELTGRRPPPYWPADPWLFVVYTGGLTAAAAAALAIHWLAPPPAGRTALALLAAVLFLAVGFALVRAAAGRSRHHERVLTDPRERATFESATADANRIMLVWPDLEAMADPPDPQGTLERALWDLTLALTERGSLRAASRELQESVSDLVGRGTVYVGVDDRAAEVAHRLAEVDAEVHRRTGHLRRLADLCERYVNERSAVTKARRRVRTVDAFLGGTSARVGGTSARAGRRYHRAEERTDHTQAVLDAYRDLAHDLDA